MLVPLHKNEPIKRLVLTCLTGLSRVKVNKMYYRVLFRAIPTDVYYFEHHANDKARVYDVIHRVKEYFKIKYSTIKVFDGEIELSPEDYIHCGKTYILRRLPNDDDNQRHHLGYRR